MIWI
jgi:hypothetical protein